MMEEADLTRLAVEEIVREMEANNEERERPLRERKFNPMGKPNKRFLGRTLNSMLTHNKREDVRTQESCRRKLTELDIRRRRRLREKSYSRGRDMKKDRQRSRSESSHKIYTTSSSSSEERSLKNSRRRKRKKRSKRRSSSSKERKQDEYDEEDYHYTAAFYHPEENEMSGAIMATMAYNQINNFLHYQAIMATSEATGAAAICDNSVLKSEIPASIEVTSTHSSTTLLSSSSLSTGLEEDENGMLTIQVSSDDILNDEKRKRTKKERRRLSSCSRISVSSSSSSCQEVISMVSCISLDSAESKKPLSNFNSSNSSIEILTCSSDANSVENKKIPEAHENQVPDSMEMEIGEISIDLTEE